MMDMILAILGFIIGIYLFRGIVTKGIRNEINDVCKLHTWTYLEEGGMQCQKCKYKAGT